MDRKSDSLRFLFIAEICIKSISMRVQPTGAGAICDVLRVIQCICQPASHGPALLSSAYIQSIPLPQYRSTSECLDILSLLLFLLASLMQTPKGST